MDISDVLADFDRLHTLSDLSLQDPRDPIFRQHRHSIPRKSLPYRLPAPPSSQPDLRTYLSDVHLPRHSIRLDGSDRPSPAARNVPDPPRTRDSPMNLQTDDQHHLHSTSTKISDSPQNHEFNGRDPYTTSPSHSNQTVPFTHKLPPLPTEAYAEARHTLPAESQTPFPRPHPLPTPSPRSTMIVLSPRPDSPLSSVPGSRRQSPQRRPIPCPVDGSVSAKSSRGSSPAAQQKQKRRKSWMPGRSSVLQTSEPTSSDVSYMLVPNAKIPYDMTPLLTFHQVAELWDPEGDTLVYLHDRSTMLGPSFRIKSSLFSSSKILLRASFGKVSALGSSASWHGSEKSFSSGFRSAQDDQDIHLCLPQPLRIHLSDCMPSRFTQDDIETMITVRNAFAFLAGQPLVTAGKQGNVFEVLMHLSQVLYRYDFTNLDGSSLGEVVDVRFADCMRDFGLGDVRENVPKIIEALVLGERMRCWTLYNEAFAHAVGKYDDLMTLNSPRMYEVHELTRSRLARSSLQLDMRLRNVKTRLEAFEFPSLFTKVAAEQKGWKPSFLLMRRHVVSFYKAHFGAWPPRKLGLNRVVLLQLYQDMCDLYDVLVDRTNLTTRNADLPLPEADPTNRALRKVLSDYDKSLPPTQPPIPFDVPNLPSLRSLRRHSGKSSKKLKDDEINSALMQSYNRDLLRSTPFMEAFFAHERRSAHGSSMQEVVELRQGQWIFVYAVIQSLPLVIVDAPGLQFGDDVPYFLCEFCKESPPWLKQEKRTTWRIPGSDTMVDMPAAAVEHSIDAIYQRSHCWQVAKRWAEVTVEEAVVERLVDPSCSSWETASDSAYTTSAFSDLAPPTLSEAEFQPRSRDRRSSVLGLGLEQLPMPSGVGMTLPHSRPASAYDPSKNFNAILGLDASGKKKKS